MAKKYDDISQVPPDELPPPLPLPDAPPPQASPLPQIPLPAHDLTQQQQPSDPPPQQSQAQGVPVAMDDDLKLMLERMASAIVRIEIILGQAVA